MRALNDSHADGNHSGVSPRLRMVWIPTLIYLISLAAYLGTAADRLKAPSGDNHYVYLANDFLHGRLHLEGQPPHLNDWSQVSELELKDGRKVRGSFLVTGGTGWFKTTKGKRLEITSDMIRSRREVYYVSFPWFPAILMMPFVAIFGMKFNDVIFTACLAAFNPVLIYFVLRRLSALRLSLRSLSEDLWLTACFAFGTVHYFSAVLGQVWYTAHIVGVTLTCLYVLFILEGRHPAWAGLCLGLGFVTRTPIPFIFPFAIGEILRHHLAAALPDTATDEVAPSSDSAPSLFARAKAAWPRVNKPAAFKDLLRFGLPAGAVALVACVLNYLRFDRAFEFGHYYLNVRWTERIQRWGLFNYHFVSRNLAVMLALLPRIMTKYPYVQVSWHGVSLFVTTPIFATLIKPARRSPLQPWLYLSVLLPMVLHLLYQNSGWQQFGFRFSLDYTVLLFVLLAISGRKLGYFAKFLIVFGICVNTFGAITFYRYWQFYWDGIFPTE